MDKIGYTIKFLGIALGFAIGLPLLAFAMAFSIVWATNQSMLAGWIVGGGIVVVASLIAGTLCAKMILD